MKNPVSICQYRHLTNHFIRCNLHEILLLKNPYTAINITNPLTLYMQNLSKTQIVPGNPQRGQVHLVCVWGWIIFSNN